MKDIRLEHLLIENFKGIKFLDLNFGQSELSVISGGNGVGKSTVKNAYLWCLFGVTQNSKSSTIQPLDKDTNQVVHNLTTNVAVNLTVDGKHIVLRRELSEKWSVPRGKTEAVFKGTETSCYINDVPLTLSKYNSKLSEILGLDVWYMLSNSMYFLSLSQRERRAWLDELSGKLNTDDLLQKYPVVKAALEQGKTLEEYKKELYKASQKSKLNLDEIPARFDELEKLRVSFDKDALLSEKKVLETQIEQLDKALAGFSDDEIRKLASEVEIGNASLVKIGVAIRERNAVFATSKHQEFTEAKNDERRLSMECDDLRSSLRATEALVKFHKDRITELGGLWQAKNSERPKLSDIDKCPLCQRPFEDSDVAAKKDELIRSFNARKVAALSEYEKEAVDVKNNLKLALETVDSVKKELEQKENKLKEVKEKVVMLFEEYSNASDTTNIRMEVESDAEYRSIRDEVKQKQDRLKQLSINYENLTSEIQAKKADAQRRLNEVNSALGKEEVNNRIDAQQEQLMKQKAEIAQVLSDIDAKEQQVRQYEKAYIELMEDTVSSKFKLVNWKFYDRNITNDGEKEICEAVVDGVPASADNLNQGLTINAGIDIVNAFARHYGVSVPLFVDCSESVEKIIDTPCQLIALEVVKGQKVLTLNNK